MKSFAQRLIQLRKNIGLSTSQLALLLGISEKQAEALEEGYANPSEAVLIRTGTVFNVSLKYLALISDDPQCQEDHSVKEVFVVSDVESDGKIYMSDIVDTVFLKRESLKGKEHIGFLMKDNSMANSRILKGDTLIICKKKTATNGNIVLCKVGTEEAVVRRYTRRGKDVTLTAESDLKQYPTIKINTDETPFMIIGVLKEIRITQF